MATIDEATVKTLIAQAISDHEANTPHGEPEALDAIWALVAAILVFTMQLGFGLLEAGSIESINSQSILFKNLLDVAIVSFGWWGWGYSVHSSTGNGFSGGTDFIFTNPSEDWLLLFFHWTFAATAATIVSGAVTGRMRFRVYIFVSAAMGWVVFPLFSHWAWASNGWLYERGFIDFAGSGVVHLGGGVAALISSFLVGPRSSRFEYMHDRGVWVDHKPRGHSIMMAFLGTFLLCFGWFGFNAGSTLGVSNGQWVVAATCLFNTGLAACTSILSMTCLCHFLPGKFSLFDVLNAALAGLVAVTAGCATMTAWGVFITGLVSGPLCKLSSYVIARLRIDDPVDAVSVHGVCGILGLIVPAIFSKQEYIDRAYGVGHIDFRGGHQFGVQLQGMLAMIGFAVLIISSILTFWRFMPGGIRIDAKDELVGNDYGYFGGYAYPDWEERVRTARQQHERMTELQRRRHKKQYEDLTSGNAKPGVRYRSNIISDYKMSTMFSSGDALPQGDVVRLRNRARSAVAGKSKFSLSPRNLNDSGRGMDASNSQPGGRASMPSVRPLGDTVKMMNDLEAAREEERSKLKEEEHPGKQEEVSSPIQTERQPSATATSHGSELGGQQNQVPV
mmetsp:Transcript_20673/g.30933  ORF Transcript_20673/g.30933 Transcript_20673/m.30933 type:complete len:618 (-) Transcript_20673:163-2016(-)